MHRGPRLSHILLRLLHLLYLIHLLHIHSTLLRTPWYGRFNLRYRDTCKCIDVLLCYICYNMIRLLNDLIKYMCLTSYGVYVLVPSADLLSFA